MDNDPGLVKEALAGAAAGTMATLAMTALMEAGQQAGLLGEMPPRLLTQQALTEAGAEVPGPVTDALSAVVHVAVGAGAGAGYAVTRRVLGMRSAGPVSGAVYGVAFWAVSYIGVIPALGILPPPTRDRAGRPPVMVAAHVLFGAVTGALVARLEKRATT